MKRADLYFNPKTSSFQRLLQFSFHLCYIAGGKHIVVDVTNSTTKSVTVPRKPVRDLYCQSHSVPEVPSIVDPAESSEKSPASKKKQKLTHDSLDQVIVMSSAKPKLKSIKRISVVDPIDVDSLEAMMEPELGSEIADFLTCANDLSDRNPTESDEDDGKNFGSSSIEFEYDGEGSEAISKSSVASMTTESKYLPPHMRAGGSGVAA